MRVLITDAQAPAAVAAVRSLGRLGIEPVVGCPAGAVPLASYSRYCAGRLPLPDPSADPDAYAGAMLDEVRRGDLDAVLPLSDQTFAACAGVRDEIERSVAYCAASNRALEAAWDKWDLLNRGRAVALPSPVARLVDDEADWREARREVGVPLVLRARWSVRRNGDRLVKPATGVHFDDASADRDARGRIDRGEAFVVSRWVRGTGRGVYLFIAGGRAVLRFGHIRLRETNPCGSPACAALADVPDDTAVERCARLLADLGVEGAAMVEFRRTADEGEDRLVEVNPRLWGSVSLAIGAGLDFPVHQVRFFARGTVPAMPERLAPVVGFRYLAGELSHLVHAWKGPPPSWGGDFPRFGTAWGGFVQSFRDGFGYYHQSTEDPVPGIVEPIAYALGRMRRARS